MHYVYILINSKTKKLYTGRTDNLNKRIYDHHSGKTKSTNISGKWKLVYYEAFTNKIDATKREWNLKHKGRQRDFLKENIKNSIKD